MGNRLVDTETARLLKQLGFDEPCYWYGNKESFGEFVRSSQTNVIMIPTIYQARDWLYTKYDIWLEVTKSVVRHHFSVCQYEFDSRKELPEIYATPSDALKEELLNVLKGLKSCK